jgi:Uma2 family endonuclease
MTKSVLTYEDYVTLPADGQRYELHEGELSVTPAPGMRHQDILLNLTLILAPHIRASGHGKFFLSPFDCIMSNVTVVEPDLLYLDDSRLRLAGERGIEGAPTLAVEIISPSSRHIDRRAKMTLYAQYGVDYYWIVDPVSQSIEAYHLSRSEYRLAAKLEGVEARVLPPFFDLALNPSDVWR